jgi:hypothetical protein
MSFPSLIYSGAGMTEERERQQEFLKERGRLENCKTH